MALGYDGKLYILAFDHRGSFQKKMFGIEGEPTPEQTDTIADAKHLIFEGMLLAADRGVEPDVWKIEGIETQEDCARIAQTARRDGRDGVICVVLGRGADDAKVDHWLRQGAPVEGYAGFAIGRTIWWDALKGFLDGNLERDVAAQQVADNYLRFVKVYDDAESAARV